MQNVAKKFEQMGARAKVYEPEWKSDTPFLRVDIQEDKRGPYFDICANIHLEVLDVQPKEKHLVLMARESHDKKPKFLCGFDERGWFAAALPEPNSVKWHPKTKPNLRRGISDVASAKAAPPAVVEAEQRKKVKPRKRNHRVNEASKRQGEWFFIPDRIEVDEKLILRDEPIRMGSRREHICEELYRFGGDVVWRNWRNPNGISEYGRTCCSW